MVPKRRPLIAIGYTYNVRKVLSFIITENPGSTQAGPTYLSKYTNQFSNVSICSFDLLLVMYNFFGSVNGFDSPKKSRQSDLALEKFWVTQYGWLQLYTSVDMVMNITNLWKTFRYGVKKDHYDKLIGIRELLERLALDCFNNTFSNDTGTPKKYIPPLMRSIKEKQFLLAV